MKKVYYIFNTIAVIAVLILSQSLVSCEEEPVFSCDSTVNEWVKENLVELKLLNRD